MKRILAGFIALVMIITAVPNVATRVVAAENGAIFNVTGYRADAGQYVFTFTMDGATSEGDKYWNCGAPVVIDGMAAGDTSVVNWLGDTAGSNQMHLVIQASAFESDETSTAAIGKHTVVLQKGTDIGGITVANDVAFLIEGTSIVEKTVVTLSLNNVGAQDFATRYLFTFDVEGTEVTDRFWNDNVVYVDGVAKTGEGVNYACSSETQLLFCLDYSFVESGKSYATEIGTHDLTIKAGTILGPDCVIGNTLSYKIDGQVVSASVPQEIVTLTDRDSSGSTDGNGFYFVVNPTDSYPNDESWGTNTFFSSGGIYIDGELQSDVFLKKVLNNLYYVCLADVNKSVAANQVVTVDGSIRNDDVEVVFTKTSFIFTGSEWNIYTAVPEEPELPGESETIEFKFTGINKAFLHTTNDWFIYLDTSVLVPGTPDSTTYRLEVNVDGNDLGEQNFTLASDNKNPLFLALSQSQLQVGDKAVEIVVKTKTGEEVTLVEDFTFYLNVDGTFTTTPIADRENWSEEPYTVYDLFDLESTSSIEVVNDAYFNLTDLKQSTNVGLKAHVIAEYTNEYQDYTFAISKSVANNVWVPSGYSVKIYPMRGMLCLFGENPDVPLASALCEDVKTDFDIEYGLVNMVENSQIVARKLYVKVNGLEVATYFDTNLDYELGTYVPAYAYSHESDFKLVLESISNKGYVLVNKAPVVQDISEVMDDLSSIKVTPESVNYIGEMKNSRNIALKTQVIIKSDFDTYVDPRYDEFKIGIGQTDANTLWDLEQSGYEVWFRPDMVYIGAGDSEPMAYTNYELPDKFTLEFGTYNIEIQKGGKKTGDYGRVVYVKIDGVEVLSWTDKDFDRPLGKHAMVYATKSVDLRLKSLTSDKYLIRKRNTVVDLYDACGLSEVNLNKGNLTKLGELPKSTSVALRTKVKMNTTCDELKLAISKTVNDNFWDLDKSGWEFWFRPASGQIFIGYEHEYYGAVVGHEFSKNFLLEIGERDVVYNDGTKYGREIYIKIDGEEVLTWIDKDYSRKLGTYVSAWVSQNGNATLYSLTTKGYVPVDSTYTANDLYDVSSYASVDLIKNACLNLGTLEDFVNHSIKMNVKLNKSASEFKIATAKTSDSTIWDIEASGWQFWFRPASNQIFIGYGVSEYAEVIGYEFPEEFELEIGARNVHFKNGKFYGVRVFVNINGEEVLSWIDTDASRELGNNIIAYAAGDADITLSTLYKTRTLPVSYLVNGEESDTCDLVSVTSQVVLGKPSKINVTVKKNPDLYVIYDSFKVNDKEVEALSETAGTYSYLLENPTESDAIQLVIRTQKITVDKPVILDFFDVAGVASRTVKTQEDAAIGNMIYEGNACKANNAMKFAIDFSNVVNNVRISLFGDWTSIWGYSGFIVNFSGGKVLIQYPASQGTLAEGQCALIQPGNSVVVEAGIVKCYVDGVYKFDRYYVKAGEQPDDLEMVTWYDSTWRGGYGTGVNARGTDEKGEYFTLRSTKNIYSITDISSKEEKEKLDTYTQFGNAVYALYHSTEAAEGSKVFIKICPKEGMKLQSLKVNGKTVKTTLAEDGTYVYEFSIKEDVKFAYTLTKGGKN